MLKIAREIRLKLMYKIEEQSSSSCMDRAALSSWANKSTLLLWHCFLPSDAHPWFQSNRTSLCRWESNGIAFGPSGAIAPRGAFSASAPKPNLFSSLLPSSRFPQIPPASHQIHGSRKLRTQNLTRRGSSTDAGYRKVSRTRTATTHCDDTDSTRLCTWCPRRAAADPAVRPCPPPLDINAATTTTFLTICRYFPAIL